MNYSDSLWKYALCYTIMFILTWISKRNKSNRLFSSEGLLAANAGYLMVLHFAGIFWFGLVPIVLLKYSIKTFLLGSEYLNFFWVLFLALLLIIIALTAFRESSKIYVKQGYIHTPSNKFFSYYFPLRILFLCAYELFFRGFLLFDCIKWFGIFPAIILSTCLTILIHVFTNKKEMWGCIPFGIILCSCCIAFKAVWPAIILHLTLSLAYEIPLTHQFINQLKFSK
jgi:membrane protease YdiL (CAAX protease family)